MGKQFACFLLFRILLPLSLFGAALVRYNGFSLTYLLLLLVAPLIPGARPNTMSGHTGRYLIFVTVLSGLMLLSQAIFQGVLIGTAKDGKDYGWNFPNCSQAEKGLRQFGLQRLQSDDVINIVRVILPDIGVFIVSLIVTITCFRLLPRTELMLGQIQQQPTTAMVRKRGRTSQLVTTVCQVLVALLLALSGIALPSLLSSTYFLSFLGVATWWGCYRSLGKRFAVFKATLLVYSAMHLVLLYLYQFQFFQDAVNPSDFYARLFGLTGVIKTNCDRPWMVELWPNKWPVYANPGIILLLYIILAIDTRRWCERSSNASSDGAAYLVGVSPKRRSTRVSQASEHQVEPAGGAEEVGNTQLYNA